MTSQLCACSSERSLALANLNIWGLEMHRAGSSCWKQHLEQWWKGVGYLAVTNYCQPALIHWTTFALQNNGEPSNQKEFWAVGVRSRCDKCISCRTCSMTQIYDWCHIGSNFFKARGWKNSRRVGKKQYAQKTFPYLSTHCFKGHRTRNFPFLERARCKSQQVHAPAEMCSPSAPSLLPAIASAFCSCMTDDAWKEGDELCHVSASAACVYSWAHLSLLHECCANGCWALCYLRM